MQEQQTTSKGMNPIIFWGVAGGMGLIVLSIISYMMELHGNNVLQFVFYAVIILVMILGIQQKRTELGGYINYGGAFITGLLIALVAGFISAIYLFIYLNFVDPSTLDLILEQSKQSIYDQNLSEIEEQRAISATKIFINPAFIALASMIIYFIVGVFGSLIVSAFLKNNPPEGEIVR